MQKRIAHFCSHLFIDEAHHAEAKTWRNFRENFEDKLVLQFTATPFREDGQKLDGKFIYIYSLKAAQEENYFKPIRFHPISEFNSKTGDIEIAKAALKALDEDRTGRHIVMARVDSKARAEEIFKLYQELGKGRHEAIVIHSGMRASTIRIEKQKLFDGDAKIVVCVDMLGEGFDLPELKIAAFHDIRKSLSVTLQLAGRFTRSRPDLGDALFITNIALIEVRDELQQLYSRDPDWNELLPALSGAAIEDEVATQKFFKGFARFLDQVPLKDLRPAASMVVYRTDCGKWKPENFRKGFRRRSSRDKLFHTINRDENTLVVLAATEDTVRWSDVESIRETNWELLIAIWDSTLELLYIHGSGINGEYREFAKAICGKEVKLIVAPEVFRSFDGVKRLVMNNVGLEEHLGRQVRYTGRMGSDVEAKIGQDARRTAKRAVLAGTGYQDGARVTVGAAKRGRVWSTLRLRIDSFSQ
ncbi:DEAD/DEAH box helicase [Herbaspirillum sp. CAH-3]|uniref:DEAD/DEAH box helicase n=1 Tax=Herbaspirillum sp. CAH-3 TaxID=2605746 RepID=UPI00351AF09E